MRTSDFDYLLPPGQIAQTPLEPRDASRLLVLDRARGSQTHTTFRKFVDFLNPGDLLVINRSRVILARLAAYKIPGRGKVELLLLERLNDRQWKALVGGKGLGVGKQLELENGTRAAIEQDLGGAQRLLAFEPPVEAQLGSLGAVPLPPYIHSQLADPERYQTVYAREAGSAAAPTAGLHFTLRLMEAIKAKGVRFADLTLHIGLDTFAPVTEADPQKHLIHTEWCQLSAETARLVNETRAAGARVIAVGTTSVRVLESAAALARQGGILPFEGRTDLFILPGYKFRVVDAMLTNFHLPRSTLLMLVSAFAGRELILETYRAAVAEGYRFYSFGDAMLIV
ncbi:MAG TPA: tRNA preQ1(34) S-adenosylmethionine ribosyltransferase-isomerase QueA [Anaerolineales bacterium]|nr:tRNA preQ1(34) S-adenosylmethionine ribosyltransferase-isomerase QueA [Anaerolineales bacterium]